MGCRHLVAHLTGLTIPVDGFAYRHKAGFRTAHQLAVHRSQLLLNHFKTIQVGRQRRRLSSFPIAGLIRLVGIGQLVMTQGDETVLVKQRTGGAAQVPQGRIGFRALLLEHIFRSLSHQSVQGESAFHARHGTENLFALLGHLIGDRLGPHIKSQCPAVFLTQGVCVSRHASAVDPLGDGGMQPQQ